MIGYIFRLLTKPIRQSASASDQLITPTAEEVRLAAVLDELDIIRPGEHLVQTWNSLLDGQERRRR